VTTKLGEVEVVGEVFNDVVEGEIIFNDGAVTF